MNIALTGGNGYIGSHILDELLSHGHEVTALVRNEEEAEKAAVPERDARAYRFHSSWYPTPRTVLNSGRNGEVSSLARSRLM